MIPGSSIGAPLRPSYTGASTGAGSGARQRADTPSGRRFSRRNDGRSTWRTDGLVLSRRSMMRSARSSSRTPRRIHSARRSAPIRFRSTSSRPRSARTSNERTRMGALSRAARWPAATKGPVRWSVCRQSPSGKCSLTADPSRPREAARAALDRARRDRAGLEGRALGRIHGADPPTTIWSVPSSPKTNTSVLMRISSPAAGTSIATVVSVASIRPSGPPDASVVSIEVARRSPIWWPSDPGSSA